MPPEVTYFRDLRGRARETTVAQLYVGLDLVGGTAAFDAELAKAKGSVRAYLAAHYDDFVPITNPKLVKVAKAAGVDLDKVFDAAGAPLAVPV